MLKITDFTSDIQILLLRMMISNPDLYARVSSIMNPENFDKGSTRNAAKFIAEYAHEHKTMPTPMQIKAIAKIDCDEVAEVKTGDTHTQWFLDTFEAFTKRKEIERAIMEAFTLIEKGEFDPVEKMIKDAVQISLQRDLGTDYFANPRERLMGIKSNNGQMTTGWNAMDRALYGGFNRGELQIFAGCSGAGKSLFMQNLSVNWVMNGLSGIYFTLELSEDLCCMRIDSMVTGVKTKEIFKHLDDVEMRVMNARRKAQGSLQVKYLPAQSTVNHLRAACREYQIQTGKKLDFICVDYLDLLMPVGAKVNPSDLFVKDKYVSEELRNLAKELNVIFVTASQLNRSAVEEVEFDHSMISGGISKINTADNVFGIFTSRSMRERGQYQLQLMKTRSSSGVGSKIELAFDVDTLRITDTSEEPQPDAYRPPAMVQVQQQARPVTVNREEEQIDQETGEIKTVPVVKQTLAGVQSGKLKALLGNLKSGK